MASVQASPAHLPLTAAAPKSSSVVKNLVKEISDDLNVSGDDFVREDFDVKTFTSAILKTQQLTEHLGKLAVSVNVLDTEIKEQVSEHHEDLLHQAINIETLEEMLDLVQTRIASLKGTSERLRLKIITPYNELNLRIRQLSRLQAACDTLRRIKGILHHSGRLRQHMQAGVKDIVKSAQCLNELEFLLRDFDPQGIDIIERDVHFSHKSRHEVEEQAQVILEKSLSHQDQSQIGTGLQVFYSLGVLAPKLAHVITLNEKKFQKRVQELLDTTNLTLQSTTGSSASLSSLANSASMSQFPGRSNMPNVGSMSQFRANLWANVDKIMDSMLDACAQTTQLQQILEKKKDLVTNLYYVDEVDLRALFKGKMYLAEESRQRHQVDSEESAGQQQSRVLAYESICAVLNPAAVNSKRGIEFLYDQWRQFTSTLSACLLAACNQSNYIKQTFQNEYPKLLKLQNDLWLRLVQLNPLVERYQYLEGHSDQVKSRKSSQSSQQEKPTYLGAYELLRKCFLDLENSYLNRSLAHLFDPINLIFSQNIDKHISRGDIETYVKGIQSQMQTLQYDLYMHSSGDLLSSSLRSSAVTTSTPTSPSFSDKVVTNVCKSIQMYANKSEQVINSLNFDLANSSSSAAKNNANVSPATPSDSTGQSTMFDQQIQTKNLDYVNVTHDLHEQLRLMFENDYKLPQRLQDKLTGSLKALLTFEENAISPFVSSASEYILAILLTMHAEDFSATNQPFSLYMRELQQVLQRVCRDYLSLYNCKSILNPFMNQLAVKCIDLFIRHASILRPLSDPARLRLVKDSHQLEDIIQTILCPKLTDLGTVYKQLKAFRHLLQTSSPLEATGDCKEVVDESHFTGVLGESLPNSVLLHYLFSYAPADLKSPHQSLDWPVAKYSHWLDSHVSERERLLVVKTCLEAYVNAVTQKGERQFATIYPLMIGLLEKSLEAIA